jgi:hypothetical protein
MRRFLFSMMLVSCAAMADELADADKFLSAKQYDKALPLYTRLANAGNAEAQYRVGEMAWFGDGTKQDLQAAQRWFEKSAAAGNPDAREALAALERRKTRGGEIGYWTQAYKGEDLRAGKFECKAPAIPAVSKTNADVDATRKAIEGWQTCYNGFVANLNATAPIARRVPADVLDMMTPLEVDQARAHIDTVYREVLARAEDDAQSVRTQQFAWEQATQRFAGEENARIARVNEVETRDIIEARRRALLSAEINYRERAPTTTSTKR